MTHWGALVFLAAVISVSFAFLMRKTPKEGLIFGLKMFLGLVLFVIVVGWIAFFIP